MTGHRHQCLSRAFYFAAATAVMVYLVSYHNLESVVRNKPAREDETVTGKVLSNLAKEVPGSRSSYESELIDESDTQNKNTSVQTYVPSGNRDTPKGYISRESFVSEASLQRTRSELGISAETTTFMDNFFANCPNVFSCNLQEHLGGTYLLPLPSMLKPNEWCALVRIQKTASKTVTKLLLKLLNSRGRQSCSRETALAASFVPQPKELHSVLAKAQQSHIRDIANDPHEKPSSNWSHSRFLSNREFRYLAYPVSFLDRRRISRYAETKIGYSFPSYNASAVAPWYKGALHPHFDYHRNSPESEGMVGAGYASVAECEECKYWRRCHMHIRDVYGILAEMEHVLPDQVRLLSLVRHPAPRTFSEFKYVANMGWRPWDYIVHRSFHESINSLSLMVPKERENAFRKFLEYESHSYGMRNRQVKMLSGLVVEPQLVPVDVVQRAIKSGDLPKFLCSRRQECAKNGTGAIFSSEYLKWAETALREAKFQLLRNPAFIVTERLEESIAVFLYSVDWRPSVTLDGRYFPATQLSHDKVLREPLGTFTADKYCKTRKLSCVFNTALECAVIRKYDPSLPWCRLLGVANRTVKEVTERHPSDNERWPLSDTANEATLAYNMLDLSLFEFAQKLLSIRVAAISRALAT
eukprot:gb/GECG01014395.1/.p1 GENE.gb/GECG01014395.1/~~gb/GECG01014395.1/.p1  ORF type:complete len:641 (+),score=53.22 gb/GECG01014395.1/:1-1923(+)